MSPALNGSSALQHFERSKVIEMWSSVQLLPGTATDDIQFLYWTATCM